MRRMGLTDDELRNHISSRHMDISLYEGASLYPLENVVVFPLWNLSGQFIGFQQYRPLASKDKRNNPRDGRYYTIYRKGQHAVWGLESWDFDNRLVVLTEGIFDACRLHNRGVPAIAVLGSNTKHLNNWLYSVNRKIFKVDDLERSNLGNYESIRCPAKDLGECDNSQLDDVICEINTRLFR